MQKFAIISVNFRLTLSARGPEMIPMRTLLIVDFFPPKHK